MLTRAVMNVLEDYILTIEEKAERPDLKLRLLYFEKKKDYKPKAWK